MIAGLASLVFIPLLAISMVHFLWAFGSTFPARDEENLVQTVAGFKGATAMPPRPVTFLVAVLVFAMGLWALALTDATPSLVLTLGGAVCALIFLGRGIVGFTPRWREMTPQEPFATFDKKLYSPLSLGIGIGFLWLTILRLI